jgi:hypothetical protein
MFRWFWKQIKRLVKWFVKFVIPGVGKVVMDWMGYGEYDVDVPNVGTFTVTFTPAV